MGEYGERLIKSAKQALEIVKGTAKPGTYRITTYDEDGKPHIIADVSDEFLAQIDAEIAAEEAQAKPAEARAVTPSNVMQKDEA